MRLVDPDRMGPLRRFGDAHIFYVLHTLSIEGMMGRGKLSEAVGLGEGSVRKILETLRRWGMIDIKRTGIAINEKGRTFLRDISLRLVDIPPSEFIDTEFHQGVIVTGAAESITDGMHQRDRGIVAGASEAAVFVLADGALIKPPEWNMDCRDPGFAAKVREARACDGDAVVICGASEQSTATVAAIAVGLEML